MNDQRGRKPEDRTVPATVVKAARVWVDLESVERDRRRPDLPARTWRMRRDRQNEGSSYTGSNASFATLEQYAWDEARRWALGFLQEQGVWVDRDSRWRDHEVELADILAKALSDG